MSYLLSGLDLVVNNQTINVVSTAPTFVNGDITPSDKIVVVGNAYNRFTNPDNTPAATIKSTNTSANLSGLTAKAVGTTDVPIATSFNNKLNNTVNLTYDGEYYVKLLLGTASTSTTISDSSNNLYSIVSSNATANASNPFGSGSTYNSVSFNGTTSYLTINNPVSSFLGSEDFTIEFFINATNFTGGPVIIDTGTNLGFQYWQVSLTATGTVQFVYTYGTSTTTTVATTSTLTAGTWAHVAIVRYNTVQTPGNNFNIYINGVSGVSALIANKWGDTGTVASSISIGKKLNNTLYFNGLLSNLRITQSAVYTGAFTKPSATLATTQLAGTNIALIPAGRKLNTKSSTTSSTSARYEPLQLNLYSKLSYNTQFGKTSVYDPTLVGNSIINSYTAPTGNQNIRSDIEVFNVGLSPEFTINGSDKPNVLGTSLANNIITTGGAAFNMSTAFNLIAEPYGSILFPSGHTSTLSYNIVASITDDFTFECWFNPTSLGTNNCIFDLRNGDVTNIAPLLCINSGILTYSIGNTVQITGPTVSTNTWYHVAVAKSSGVTKLFVNGTQSGTNYTDATGYLGYIKIGAFSTTLGFFEGNISNIRFVKGVAVYTAAFTVPTKGLQIYQNANQNGNPSAAITSAQTLLLVTTGYNTYEGYKDRSVNAATVGSTGTLSTSAFNPFVNASVSTTSSTNFNFGFGDFTIEAWVYPLDNLGFGVFNGFNNSVNSYAFGECQMAANSGTPATGYAYAPGFIWAAGSAAVTSINPAGNTASYLTLKSWNHVAVTRTNGTLAIYVNGNYSVSSSVPQTMGFSLGSTYLGGGNVYLSNIRVVKGTAVYTGTNNFSISRVDLNTTGFQIGGVSTIPPKSTVLLTLQGTQLSDNSDYNINIINNKGVSFASQSGSYSLTNTIIQGPPAYVSTPSANETLIEYVTNSTNPNLVNKRVKNLIAGTTGVIEELQSWS